MARIRVRVSAGPRAELHEIGSDEVVLGRDDECELSILDDSVAPRHARLLIRRGRLLLVDLGGSQKGVRLGDDCIRAPIAVEAGAAFELGDVRVQAWIAAEPSLVGRRVDGREVVAEIDGAGGDVRRYHVLDHAVGHAELAVAEPSVEPSLRSRWAGRVEQTIAADCPHLPGVLAHGLVDELPHVVEAVPGGMRLDVLVRSVARSALRAPVEAAALILAQIAEAAGVLQRSWGPHGAVEPRLVQLGLMGTVSLLRPGPNPQGFEDADRRPYLAPERRYGVAASAAADAWSIGALADALLGHEPRRDWPDALAAILAPLGAEDPGDRPGDLEEVGAALRSAAHGAGLDPSLSHVARLVRLLAPAAGRPLARPRRRWEAVGQSGPMR